jgi:adenylate kinase
MNDEIKKIASWLGHGSINVIGCPFSGKDTQGEILVKLFNGVLIGGGDILRSHNDPGKIERIMAEGELIPSDFFLSLMLPYFSKPEFKDKPLILSSVGRSHGEEKTIMQHLTDSGHPMKAVVLLKLTEADVWRRFHAAQADHDRGNRADDQAGVLKTRLEEFKKKTTPVIEFYREKGLLIVVDGAPATNIVTKEILYALSTLAQALPID